MNIKHSTRTPRFQYAVRFDPRVYSLEKRGILDIHICNSVAEY